MYTLRLFEQKDEIGRLQIYLGESYNVMKVEEEDEKLGIIFRIFAGGSNIVSNDGFAIYKHQYAYIMSPNGQTFETLNRPLENDQSTHAPSKKGKIVEYSDALLAVKDSEQTTVEDIQQEVLDYYGVTVPEKEIMIIRGF